VNTVARSGYEQQCPNVSRLFKQMAFNVDLENGVITDVLEKKTNVDAAATDALKRHPELLKSWLDGVTTASGGNGLEAVQTALGVK
jgi:glycine betaine/proline transport system substrate-binding protein